MNDQPRSGMTSCNDEHFFGCLNALERDAAKRAAHRASKMGFQREACGLIHLDEPPPPLVRLESGEMGETRRDLAA